MDKNIKFEESIIPKEVWKFVKKFISNPISAGILAMIIANFMKKHNKESLDDTELNNKILTEMRKL